MKRKVLLLAAALLASLQSAQADVPSQEAACEAFVADEARRKAITWLENRVETLRQLENPSEGDVTLLNELESRLSNMNERASPDRDSDRPGCEPNDNSGPSNQIS